MSIEDGAYKGHYQLGGNPKTMSWYQTSDGVLELHPDGLLIAQDPEGSLLDSEAVIIDGPDPNYGWTCYPHEGLEAPTSEQLVMDLSASVRRILVGILTAHGEPTAAQKAEAIEVVRRLDREYGETVLATDLRELRGQVDVAEDAGNIAGIISPDGKESLLRSCLQVVASQDPSVPTSDVEMLAEIGAAMGMSSAHVRGVVSQVTDRPPAIEA